MAPSDATLEPRTLAVLGDAKALVIDCASMYERAALFLQEIKGLRHEIEATFSEPIAKAFAAHKAVVAAKKKHDAPLDEAERLVKGAMVNYRAQEELKARELQATLQQEATLQQAVQAEAEGDHQQAEAILSGQAMTPPVIVPANVPKVDGVSFRTTWNAELLNLAELIQAVAKGQAPMTLLTIDKTALREYVRATRGSVVIPGIRVFTQQHVGAKA